MLALLMESYYDFDYPHEPLPLNSSTGCDHLFLGTQIALCNWVPAGKPKLTLSLCTETVYTHHLHLKDLLTEGGKKALRYVHIVHMVIMQRYENHPRFNIVCMFFSPFGIYPTICFTFKIHVWNCIHSHINY